MQRRVLLGAGAVVLVVVGLVAMRSATRRQAGHAVDQGIDALVAHLPPGYAIRHGVTDYNPLTSSLTVHDAVVTHDGVTLWTADSVTISGADGQALQDVFDPAAYPNGRPAWTGRKLLIADASADGVRITPPAPPGSASGDAGPPPGAATIRRVMLHRLSGRPFMMPPTPENRSNPALAADAALALSVDTLQERDAVLTTETPSKSGVSKNVFAVGAVTLSDYDAGKFGSFAIKDVAANGDGKPRGTPFHLAIDAIGAKDGDFRSTLELIRNSGHADRSMLSHATYASAGLSGMVFDVASGPHIEVHDVQGSQAYSDGVLAGGTGWVHGLTMALGQSRLPPAAAPAVAAFGMTAITFDVDAKSHIDAATRQAVLHEDIVLHDLGTMHLDGTFSGYDAALGTAAQPLGAVMATTLDHGTIVYQDNSLTNRLLAVAAAQTHTTPDLVRAQLAMPVVTLGLMLPDQPDVAEQVTNFLNHPNTLTVTMNPPQKVTIGDIQAAPVPARAHMLGVHVTSK